MMSVECYVECRVLFRVSIVECYFECHECVSIVDDVGIVSVVDAVGIVSVECRDVC